METVCLQNKSCTFTTTWQVVAKCLQTKMKNYRQLCQSKILVQRLFCNQFYPVIASSLQNHCQSSWGICIFHLQLVVVSCPVTPTCRCDLIQTKFWQKTVTCSLKSCSFSFVLFPSSSFFENMSRIIAPNYVPTDADVLRVRVRTCGIIETQFQVDKTMFR